MKLYVVMGRYLRTQDEAKARAKELGVSFSALTDIDEVPTDQKGLVAYLNNLVDNLAKPQEAVPVAVVAEPPREASYSERTVAFDTAFAQLPIAQQLTLMSLGTDNAVKEIARLNQLLATNGFAAAKVTTLGEIEAIEPEAFYNDGAVVDVDDLV